MTAQRILFILAATAVDADRFARQHKLDRGQWCALARREQVAGTERPLYVVLPGASRNPHFRELMLALHVRDAQYASIVDDGRPAPIGEIDLGPDNRVSDRQS